MTTRPHTAVPTTARTTALFASLMMALTSMTACGPQLHTNEIAHALATTSEETLISFSAAFTPEEIAAANFQFIKDKIFTPHCLKCHASDVQRGDVNLEDYSTAFQLRNEIRSEVDADRMPRRAPPLSPELKELLFSWIDNGAREL